MKIDQKNINNLCRNLENYWLNKLLKSFEVYGLDDCQILKENQILFPSNHRSHGDYVFIPYALNQAGILSPAIIAGNNLDNFLVRSIASERNGAIFIDRKKISKRYEGEEERKKLRENLERVVKDKNNLLIFPGGGRDKNRFQTGIIGNYFEKAKGKKIYVCNIALEYYPQTIEKPFLKAVDFFRNKFYPAYLGADLAAFATQPFRKKSGMKINFGKPVSINEFSNMKELAEYSKNEILELHSQISQ